MNYLVPFGVDVSVRITRFTERDEARVQVIAPLYMRKEWDMSHSYKSSEFTDQEIMRDGDFLRVLSKAYEMEA
jgi:hypothetical protein